MSLAARLEDRVSPLVVKELRQALRGRYFAISFWATLVFAMGLTILRLAGFQLGSRSLWGEDTNDGRGIFSVLYFCLAWAVGAVVPFSAFLSMGAEWEEGTFDLLVLSNLRPRQIFLGKLLSAAIQCALTMSAIVPFMAFAFLLGGIDLLLLAIMLTLLVFYSFAASAFAIALSTLARARYARLILGIILGIAVFLGTTFLLSVTSLFAAFPGSAPGEAFWFAQALLLFALSAIGLMSFAIGASRLAHSEENRSSTVRRVTFGTIAVALVFPIVGNLSPGLTFEPRILLVYGFLCFTLLGLVGLFLVTEPERLGRRTRHEVSKRGWLAFLSTPFLPGGGRGVLFVVVTSFLIGGSLGIARAIGPSGAMTHLEAPVMGGLFCAFGYIVTAIAFPSAFLTQRTAEPRGRFVVRCIIFAAVLLATITPALTAVVLGGGRVLDFNHIGNPFYFAYGPAFGGDVIFVFAACVFVTLVANIPRITRGIEEVQEASRARRHPNTNNAQAPS